MLPSSSSFRPLDISLVSTALLSVQNTALPPDRIPTYTAFTNLVLRKRILPLPRTLCFSSLNVGCNINMLSEASLIDEVWLELPPFSQSLNLIHQVSLSPALSFLIGHMKRSKLMDFKFLSNSNS